MTSIVQQRDKRTHGMIVGQHHPSFFPKIRQGDFYKLDKKALTTVGQERARIRSMPTTPDLATMADELEELEIKFGADVRIEFLDPSLKALA